MGWNGSGVYTRVSNWQADAQAGIKIKSDRHDIEGNDLANALSNCVTKDGQSQPVADLPMNGHRLTNVGDPVNPTDVANKRYTDAIKTFSTGLAISGADVNGRLNFTSSTGANGLSFTGADLSWLARLATAAGPGTPPVPPATLNRVVLNTAPDGSGTDVVTVNDNGTIVANGAITAGTVVYAKAASGNVHFWLQGPNGETRGIMYSPAASAGNLIFQNSAGQEFCLQTDASFVVPSNLYTGNGSSYVATDGNVNGSVWGGYLSTYIENRASAYANNKVAVTQIQRVGNTYSGNVGSPSGWICPAGTVIVGYARDNGVSGQVYGLYYMTLQIYDDKNGWRNMGG